MANGTERGLPPVPGGLSASLTSFLRSLRENVVRLGGQGRGSQERQAVRRSEADRLSGTAPAAGTVVSATLADGAVTAAKLADGAVTRAKVADGTLTGKKLCGATITGRELAAQCVGEAELKPGAVTASRLAGGAVTLDKLAAEALPVCLTGRSAHGECVDIGAWEERPLLCLTGLALPVPETAAALEAGLERLRQEDGTWRFDVTACWKAGDGTCAPGDLGWCALGRRKEA